MKFLKLGIISILTASALSAGTYNIDTSHSTVGFKVKHMMISNIAGNFTKFDGTYDYDEKTKTLKSLKGEITIDSINTQDQKRDAHLISADFFDTKQYPIMTFNLLKVKNDKAYGSLTIKGVTKDVQLNIETSDTIKDPWGNTRTAIALSGKINRYDFGLKYNSALETGGVAVGEDVKLNVELEGILAK